MGGLGQVRVEGVSGKQRLCSPSLVPLTPVRSTCTNGSLVCPRHECPVLGPWSAWSSCSAPCGGGSMGRRRSCEEGPMGVPCQAQDTEQQQECNPQPCPGEHLGWGSKGGASLPSGAAELGGRSAAWAAGPEAVPSLVLHLTVCALPPECPPGQVPSACAASCPHLCSNLQPGALCVQEPCRLGCSCPGEQVRTVP